MLSTGPDSSYYQHSALNILTLRELSIHAQTYWRLLLRMILRCWGLSRLLRTPDKNISFTRKCSSTFRVDGKWWISIENMKSATSYLMVLPKSAIKQFTHHVSPTHTRASGANFHASCSSVANKVRQMSASFIRFHVIILTLWDYWEEGRGFSIPVILCLWELGICKSLFDLARRLVLRLGKYKWVDYKYFHN